MRIFNDLNVAYAEIRRDLKETGVWIKGHSYQDKVVEGDETMDFMELSPYNWGFTETSNNQLLTNFAIAQELNLGWILAECDERLTPTLHCLDQVESEQIHVNNVDCHEWNLNPGKAWKLRRETWEQFLEPPAYMDSGPKFSYTYAERFDELHQFVRAIIELKKHPASRQAIVGIHQAVVDNLWLGGSRRIPCSMFYHLMVRDNKLNLHYVMRSCDVHTHFPYDVILAIMAQQMVAEQLGIELGIFTHYITSLHGFRKDFGADVF